MEVDKFIFPIDFIVLDMAEDQEIPIILGQPFLATKRRLIHVQKGQLMLRVQDDQVSFNTFKSLSFTNEGSSYFILDAVETCTKEVVPEICIDELLAVRMVDASKFTNLEVLQ